MGHTVQVGLRLDHELFIHPELQKEANYLGSEASGWMQEWSRVGFLLWLPQLEL